jgi:hypothetical protein
MFVPKAEFCRLMSNPRPTCGAQGGLALRRTASGFVIEPMRAANFDRPWSPAPVPRHVNVAPQGDDASAAAVARTPPRDVTPQPEDVEADQ